MTTDAPLNGIVHGLSNLDYHKVGALSATGLKRLAKSPAHFYGLTFDPLRPTSETTPAMVAGSLAHCATLEPDEVQNRYAVRPPGTDLRTKAGMAWRSSVPPGIEVITEDQHTTAWRQSKAIRALPEVEKLLANGQAEVSVFTQDEETGVRLKARPDFLSPVGEGLIIFDLKTTQSASAKDFPRAVVNFGYALQAVHYMDVVEKATDLEVLGFVFGCVESDYPHAAATYLLDEEWLAMARRERWHLINVYAECLRTNVWPGYPTDLQLLTPPYWLKETT